MTTATDPIIVRRVDVTPESTLEALDDGQSLAYAVNSPGFTPFTDGEDHPAALAFEREIDAALAEAAPEIAEAIRRAVERRLPWTWEPGT